MPSEYSTLKDNQHLPLSPQFLTSSNENNINTASSARRSNFEVQNEKRAKNVVIGQTIWHNFFENDFNNNCSTDWTCLMVKVVSMKISVVVFVEIDRGNNIAPADSSTDINRQSAISFQQFSFKKSTFFISSIKKQEEKQLVQLWE